MVALLSNANSVVRGPFERLPVVVLSFNRPELLRRVLEQVNRYGPSVLYFVSDGPRNELDISAVMETRRVFFSFEWGCETHVTLREKNMGCGRSVQKGLDDVFAKEESAIILEDDCLPSMEFFSFIEGAIVKYQDDSRVFMVSGLNEVGRWPSAFSGNTNLFALGGIWGWATWANRWALNDSHLRLLDTPELKGRFKKLSRGGVPSRRIRQVLEGAKAVQMGVLDTWDYQWALTRYFYGGLSVVPRKNLVENIGASPEATHTPVGTKFPRTHESSVDWKYRTSVRLDISYIWASEAVRIFRGWETILGRITKKLGNVRKLRLRISLYRGGGGEDFLGFSEVKRASKGGDLTDFVWTQKPLGRQEVPVFIIGKCKDFLNPSVGSEFSVLEVGPGTGRFLREVLIAFPHTAQYGILDADSEWAQYCAEMVILESENCVPKVSVNADADFSVFSGDRFDLVHAHAVLVQLRARLGLQIVLETARLLKPGGLLVFDTFSSEDITSLYRMSEAPWATFYHPDWLRSELESSGLEVVSRVAVPYGLNGKSEYWFAKMRGF